MIKKLIYLLLLPLSLMAQLVTTNPDTVCYQSLMPSNYEVAPDPTLTYVWMVQPPAVIVSGQGTNHVLVDWSSFPTGLIINAISVQGYNSAGCNTPAKFLNVFIYNEVVSFTQAQDVCEDDNCITLVGMPPNGVWSGVGVQNNMFCPTISGVGNFNLIYTYSNAGCSFINTMFIDVIPIPNLSPIQHD